MRIDQVWAALTAATTPPGTPFTLCQLATVHGQQPRVRSVILRSFDDVAHRLGIATHVGSAKVAEIRAQPLVAGVCYDRDRGVQLRFEGRAHVATSSRVRHAAWAELASRTHQAFATKQQPGAAWMSPDDVDGATAFERFAWRTIDIVRVEWLDLAASPYVRWRFTREAAGWHTLRIVP